MLRLLHDCVEFLKLHEQALSMAYACCRQLLQISSLVIGKGSQYQVGKSPLHVSIRSTSGNRLFSSSLTSQNQLVSIRSLMKFDMSASDSCFEGVAVDIAGVFTWRLRASNVLRWWSAGNRMATGLLALSTFQIVPRQLPLMLKLA